MTVDLQLLAQRHEIADECLTDYIRQNFSGSLLSLRTLAPFIKEIRRRFRCLPRKRGVDGNFKMIAGCRTFKEFCSKVLNRTDRAVRYAIAGIGSKPKEKAERSRTEIISALTAYVLKRFENLELTVDEKSQVISGLQGSTNQKPLMGESRSA